MLKKIIFFLCCWLLLHFETEAQLFPNLGGQRVGISALTFLNNDISPRSVGLAGYNITLNGDAYSMQTNPAAMSDLKGLQVASSNMVLLRDINHQFFAVTMPTKNDGAFGLSVTNLATSRMEKRTEFQPDGTGEFFYAANTAVGLGYAKKLSRMFSFGLNLKYVYEQLAEFREHTAVTDLGFLYRTDYKDLRFAASVQNFGFNSNLSGDQNAIPVRYNRRTFSLERNPAATVFRFGVSIVPYKDENHQLMVGTQLNHPNDDSENIRLGIEYQFRSLLFLRTGIKANVAGEQFPTGGFGIQIPAGRHSLLLEYGVNPTVHLGLLHSIGLSFRLNRDERE
jgi:hypothetical protein